ncbi:MAG: hypothetical protein JW782_03535 [Candidatus Saganbacteria bacterium]|nr:hypothetical protein [Candidatus Saganbacteria bacterium]
MSSRGKSLLSLWLAAWLLLTTAPTLPATAVSSEAGQVNFLQEFDITFWQTLPFAALWSSFAERRLSEMLFPGQGMRWQAVALSTLIISTANAWLHASQVVSENERLTVPDKALLIGR